MNVPVSPNFKKEARKTILTIVLFILVYLLLFSLAIGLTIVCVYLGVLIIIKAPMYLTLVLGVALIAFATTILIYLIKFVFTSSKTDLSHLCEVTATDEPRLFALINEIVEEVGTNFPKKVYLSSDVNAAVFYNSGFWSMFIPIRKNLQIGMGLVSSVTQQELKAILAHEFGHFSQKSMKVGSYVYNVNQIIYSLLYTNDPNNKITRGLQTISNFASVFVGLANFIIVQIQKILHLLYAKVNLNYMALSREMEFHADAIAANVAGSKALTTSLLRLQFANFALERVLLFYDEQIKKNITSGNIYREQQMVMEFLGEKNKYPFQGHFPIINLDHLKKYNKSRLNIENQWASHPSNEDRIKALEALNIVATNTIDTPAIELFQTDERACYLSSLVFNEVKYSETPEVLHPVKFMESFMERHMQYEFDDLYNGYYDINNPIINQLELPPIEGQTRNLPELLSDEKVEATYILASLREDKELLEAIIRGDIQLKTFDYDGIKYPIKQSNMVLDLICDSYRKVELEVNQNNKDLFNHFYQLAEPRGKSAHLEKLYKELAEMDDNYNRCTKQVEIFVDHTTFIYQNTPYLEITSALEALVPLEIPLKKELAYWLNSEHVTEKLDEDIKKSIDTYMANTLTYFSVTEYNDENLAHLITAINQLMPIASLAYFGKKQEILKFQIALLPEQQLAG